MLPTYSTKPRVCEVERQTAHIKQNCKFEVNEALEKVLFSMYMSFNFFTDLLRIVSGQACILKNEM